MKNKIKNRIQKLSAFLCISSLIFQSSICSVAFADDDDIDYLPGDDAYAELEGYTAEERTPGSYYIEAEDALVSGGIMKVVEDKRASEGKGIAADFSSTRANAEEIPQDDARIKFKVTEKGRYMLYVRFNSPTAKGKATHFAFDNQAWGRMEYTTVLDKFLWSTSKAPGGSLQSTTYRGAYLDEGWHTLSIRARNGGQIIDSIVISKEPWTPMGFGSLPGEDYRYTEEEIGAMEYEHSLPKLTIDGIKYLTDVYIQKEKGEIVVPMKNVCNMMDVPVQVRPDYHLAVYDRNYLKVFPNSYRAIANGKEIKMTRKSFLYEDNILMVPLSAIKTAFDMDYRFDYSDNTTYITTKFKTEDKIRRVKAEDIIEAEPQLYGANYKLKIDRPNANVRVWLKKTTFYEGQWQNYDKDHFKPGWMGTGNSIINYYWGEVAAPDYKDGGFVGDVSFIYRNDWFDMKVSVVDGNYSDTFIIEDAFKTLPLEYRAYEEDYDYIITGGKLEAIPTFENIGYYIDEADSETDCSVYYREKGTEDWKKAFDPWFDDRVTGGQYRGSIVYLKQDTTYEIKAEITKGGKRVRTETTECTTWKEDVPVKETIKLSDIYKNGSYDQLVLRDVHGSEDGWIKIVGDDDTIVNAGRDWNESIYITNSSYIILENVTVKGGDRFGINITNNSSNIRLINCDVSEWSSPSVINTWLECFLLDGNARNLDGGIRIHQCENIVVERCYIHDTLGSTNPWSLEGYWASEHPCGPSAILQGGCKGLVVRYNDMSGSDTHRFNDVMECEINGANQAGPGFDSDIYGNLWYCNEDDSIEVDSSGRNVRIYDNRSEQSRCGISTAPTTMGPLYVFRNLFVNRGDSANVESDAIKIDGGGGMQYWLNNTMTTNIRSQGSLKHAYSRNNITARSRNGSLPEEASDYNIVTGETRKNGHTTETHGFFAQPKYVNSKLGDWHLASDSIGVNDGEHLDNFSDVAVGKTDIGAFEKGGKYKFFPYRPIDVEADKYYAPIKSGSSITVSFTAGKADAGKKYEIHTNKQNEFLTLEGVGCELSGVVEAGKTYKVRIKASLSNHYYWLHGEKVYMKEGNGMLYFRLDNGLSVPVTVYVEK